MARGLDIFRKQRAARLADEQEMAQAQGDYADAKARFEAAKAEWQAARSRGDVRAERDARDRLNRARVDAEEASERYKGAQARMVSAARPASEQPESRRRSRSDQPRSPRPRPEPEPIQPRTLAPTAARAPHGKGYHPTTFPARRPTGPSADTVRRLRRQQRKAAAYQLSLHQRALAHLYGPSAERTVHEQAILELEAQMRELEAGQ